MQIDRKILWNIVKRVITTGLIGLILGLVLVTFSYLSWAIFKSAFLYVFSWADITNTTAIWLSIGVIVISYIVLALAIYFEGLPDG